MSVERFVRAQENRLGFHVANFEENLIRAEAIAQKCSVKKMFLKFFANYKGKTPVPGSLFLKRDSGIGVFL